MAEVFLAGARLPVQCFNTHARHQSPNMLASDLETLPVELVAQHARAHEWMFQMQLVHPANQDQIAGAGRLGQVNTRCLGSAPPAAPDG